MKIAHSIKSFSYIFSDLLFPGATGTGNADEIPLAVAIVVSVLIIATGALLVTGAAVYFANR